MKIPVAVLYTLYMDRTGTVKLIGALLTFHCDQAKKVLTLELEDARL